MALQDDLFAAACAAGAEERVNWPVETEDWQEKTSPFECCILFCSHDEGVRLGMRIWWVVAVAAISLVALGSCAAVLDTAENSTAETTDDAYCKRLGTLRGTPEYTWCRLTQGNARLIRQAARRGTFSEIVDALTRAGAVAQASALLPPTTRNCTSMPFGNSIDTNCQAF
jgi:hypothetical protein